MAKTGVRDIRLVFETTEGNFNRTDIHIMDRITNALAQVQNASIAVAFFDDKGHRLRKVELGEAGRDLRLVIEEELGSDEVVA